MVDKCGLIWERVKVEKSESEGYIESVVDQTPYKHGHIVRYTVNAPREVFILFVPNKET